MAYIRVYNRIMYDFAGIFSNPMSNLTRFFKLYDAKIYLSYPPTI